MRWGDIMGRSYGDLYTWFLYDEDISDVGI